jgi:hypothetical protein
MKTSLSRRHSILALMVLLTMLSACGGSGGSGSSSWPPDPIVATGSAYQKQYITFRRVGKSYGPFREFLQGQIKNCNDARAQDGLLPVVPDEAALAGIDDAVADHYFDTDKTALYMTVYGAELSDYRRGTAAPDCSIITRTQSTTAWIWRDGRVYQLNFDNKTGQSERSTTALPMPLMTEVERAALPERTVAGQKCHVIKDPLGPWAADDACLWDRFPPVLYLDMPWPLSTEYVRSDGIEQKMTTTEIGPAAGVPSSVFSIDGFTILER